MYLSLERSLKGNWYYVIGLIAHVINDQTVGSLQTRGYESVSAWFPTTGDQYH